MLGLAWKITRRLGRRGYYVSPKAHKVRGEILGQRLPFSRVNPCGDAQKYRAGRAFYEVEELPAPTHRIPMADLLSGNLAEFFRSVFVPVGMGRHK